MAVLSRKLQRLLKKLRFEKDDRRCGYEKLENGVHQKRSCSPRGSVPIYVGEERKKYMVTVKVANSAVFLAMLDEFRDEISSSGPLAVPCSVEAFEHVLRCAYEV